MQARRGLLLVGVLVFYLGTFCLPVSHWSWLTRRILRWIRIRIVVNNAGDMFEIWIWPGEIWICGTRGVVFGTQGDVICFLLTEYMISCPGTQGDIPVLRASFGTQGDVI